MNFGFRSEVGYNAAKDFTFLKTNTDDFSEQLTFPVERGSKEDLAIRELLSEQEVVDFDDINRAPVLPYTSSDMRYGVVTGTQLQAGYPDAQRHMVLFGKEGSGALNLIRLFILWAREWEKTIVTVGAPTHMYGVNVSYPHFILDPSLPLREQLEEVKARTNDGQEIVLIVGSEYDATTLQDRAFILDAQQGNLHNVTNTLIHRDTFLEKEDDDFTGSDSAFGVTYAVIGDVNDVTARKVGADVATRNPRGVMWFAYENGETTRVKTFIVPRALTY